MSCCSGFEKVPTKSFLPTKIVTHLKMNSLERGEKNKKVGTKGANITNEIVELLVFKLLSAREL